MNAYLRMQSMNLLDVRFWDKMQAIFIPEVIRDTSDKPFCLEVSVLAKNKWRFYNFLPRNYFFDVPKILDFYDTIEELDSLIRDVSV